MVVRFSVYARYYEKIAGKEPVLLENLPFDIPDSWCWCRFSELVNFSLGKTPDRHSEKFWSNGEFPWFSIADMKDKSYISTTKEKISAVALKEKFDDTLSPKGTLLMSFKLTVGRTSVLGVDAVHNEAIISIFPYITTENIIRDYLFYTLGLIVDYVEQTDAIKGATLNSSKMKAMLIPLPPLLEQKRIVKQINIIMNVIKDED